MASQEEILEGFICPICIIDLNSANQLTKHFEESHNDDPEILKSLKDLFGKAKKKILKQELQTYPPNPTISNQRKSDERNQQIGVIKSHTRYFKEIRDARLERYSSETNKLLIRLDKLLYNLPSDAGERKVHEQAIVPWIDEKVVNLCPNCAKSFNFARRKHHCRLCGAVMCQTCTMLLSLQDARKITSPALIQDDSMLSPTQESGMPYPGRLIQAGIGISKLVRSPSSGSLNSVISLISDSSYTEHFKLCQHCKHLLDARERLKAHHFEKSIIHEVYEKMRTQMEEANRYIEVYNKMWLSLCDGETTYDLRDAQVLRVKIAKIGDHIDMISKRIVSLGPSDDESAQKPETRLYNMVRYSAKIFLKEHLSSIPTLPTEEEYAVLQERKQKRTEANIIYVKQLEMEEQKERLKNVQKNDEWDQQSSSSSKQVILDQSQGWGPSNPNIMIQTSMDPIIEQMSNLRAYIKQAKADLRYDEAAILEKNLNELKSAYYATLHNSNL